MRLITLLLFVAHACVYISSGSGYSNVVFHVVPAINGVDEDNGWMLANISDVKAHLSTVKKAIDNINRWAICKLGDGWITGGGYRYQIGNTTRKIGDLLVVRYNSSMLFEVVPINKPIPDAWRLASVNEVMSTYDEVKLVLSHGKKWLLCKLEDGKVCGRGYNYRVYRGNFEKGLGDNLIVNSGVVLNTLMRENEKRTLSCSPGYALSIRSAVYGKPPKCLSSSSDRIVKNLCTGKRTCTVEATNKVFGDPCVGVGNTLAVKYQCYVSEAAVTSTATLPSTAAATTPATTKSIQDTTVVHKTTKAKTKKPPKKCWCFCRYEGCMAVVVQPKAKEMCYRFLRTCVKTSCNTKMCDTHTWKCYKVAKGNLGKRAKCIKGWVQCVKKNRKKICHKKGGKGKGGGTGKGT